MLNIYLRYKEIWNLWCTFVASISFGPSCLDLLEPRVPKAGYKLDMNINHPLTHFIL
jgi:hypothetical protein